MGAKNKMSLNQWFLNFVGLIACLASLIGDEIKPKELEVSSIADSRYFPSIGVTELRLSNGMTFCLKPTGTETDEVFFKLVALGGFASLKPENFSSGELADKIAWESGMGGMTSDQVALFLYENSLEIAPEISAFGRTIRGEGQEESIEAFFKCIKMIFTEQQFSEEGFSHAKILSRAIINKLNQDHDYSYETAFLCTNTQNFQPLRPLRIPDLAKVDFGVAKEFFRRSFSDPSDFLCVIVGAFELAKVTKLIEHYMGALPKPAMKSNLQRSFEVPFPPGVTEKTIKLASQSGCLTNVTFPLQIRVDAFTIGEIAFMCQIVEARLRRVITDKMNLSYGVDVSYEFPLYPFLENPWISIRYRCENKVIRCLKDIVITELERLQLEGATLDEVIAIKNLEKKSQEFWLKDNFYWVSMLANYYLWGWNPEKIDYKNTSIQDLTVDMVNSGLKKAISLSNYSVVTATSEKK